MEKKADTRVLYDGENREVGINYIFYFKKTGGHKSAI
jgi:hypothetical protein